MVPMNLLSAGGSADYLITGSWAAQAAREAEKFGSVRVAATTEPEGFRRLPDGCRDRRLSRRLLRARHHEQHHRRHPVARDARRSATDRWWSTHRPTSSAARSTSPGTASIYAGAQKNLGPAGVTVVIIRPDLAERGPASLPKLLRYATYVQGGSRPEHASGLRRLRGVAGHGLAARPGRSRRRGRAQRAQGGEAVRGHRPIRFLPRGGCSRTAARG